MSPEQSASRKIEFEFWFEFGSSYSYPAAMRIEEAARNAGREIVWRPFLLGPIFKEQGWADSPFNLYPAKGRYMRRDLERVCYSLNIPFQRPGKFPRNGLAAARIACAGAREAWLPEFVRRVYSANFAYDLDITDPTLLEDCLKGLVSEPNAVVTASVLDASKELLRENTKTAIELGIFGAPSFVTGGEIFWGNDRLETALHWDPLSGVDRT